MTIERAPLVADTSIVVAKSILPFGRARVAVRLRLGTASSLASLILGSIVARSLAVIAHPTIGYLPDEYTYAAISRSLATHGRPLIRGASAHFPALLEPLLAAPLWAIGSTETAYRLVQVENALFMSLTAIPVYLLARRVRLGTGYSLACAAYALASPDLGFSAFILSDPLAYPLALSAVYTGVVALETSDRRFQAAFVAFAGLATFARIEYAILAPAFVVAAILLDRRAAVRAQRLPLTLFATAALFLVAIGPGKVLGFYSAVDRLSLDRSAATWAGLDLFLLSLAGGVVLVPGAVAGLVLARGRVERSFSTLAVSVAVLILAETALYASNGAGLFRERYLLALLPLVPIAFGLFARHRPRGRLLVVLLAAGICAAAARLPLSAYTAGDGPTHSPLLWAYVALERSLGTGDASLVFALGATAAALLAAVVAWKRLELVPVVISIGLLAALSVGASVYDSAYSGTVRSLLVAPDPAWIDHARLGSVSAIETELAPPEQLLEQMFWNRSVGDELLLGSGATPTDAFATQKLTVSGDGRLIVAGRPLRGALLFHGFAVTPVFRNAVLVDRYSSFSLWRPSGTPRLSVLENGRYWDGWLALDGTLEVWPGAAGAGTLSFTLSLPRSHRIPATIHLGDRVVRLVPGQKLTTRFRVDGSRPWSIRFRATSGAVVLPDERFVSVRSTTPVFTPRVTSTRIARSRIVTRLG